MSLTLKKKKKLSPPNSPVKFIFILFYNILTYKLSLSYIIHMYIYIYVYRCTGKVDDNFCVTCLYYINVCICILVKLFEVRTDITYSVIIIWTI